jgi:hypothetical protein
MVGMLFSLFEFFVKFLLVVLKSHEEPPADEEKEADVQEELDKPIDSRITQRSLMKDRWHES